VIFRDGPSKAGQVVPYTTTAADRLDRPARPLGLDGELREKTGGDVLAMAHNGNLSNGMMFPWTTSPPARALDEAYAEARAKWEPLYEITQIKGDGEAHPLLSPDDEFADYETWDNGNLDPPRPRPRRHAAVRVRPRGAEERACC
jgi:hypothetical protein